MKCHVYYLRTENALLYLKKAWASLVAQMVKNLLAMWETWVQSPGREDILEEEIVTHSQYSCLGNSMDRRAAGKSPWDRNKWDRTQRLSN